MQNSRSTLRKKFSLSALIAAGFAISSTASAQTPTHTWLSTASGSWSTAANWASSNIATSASTTIIEFQGTGTTAANSSNDLAATPFLVNGFTFNSTNTGGLTIAGTNGFSFVVDGVTNPVINQNNTGPITITAPVNAANNLTFGGSGAGAVTLSGPITGAGTFTKTSSGTLTISGANTNTAGWTVSNGILNVTNASTTATGTVTFDNSAATLNNGLGRSGTTTGAVTLANGTTLQIRAAGDNTTATQSLVYGNDINVQSGASITLSGDRSGTVATNKSLTFGALTLANGSTVNHAGGNSFRFLMNGLNVDTAATINMTQSFMTINGAFVGTGTTPTLTKIGTTDLTLGPTSSTLDAININAGRVFITTNTIGSTVFNVAAGAGNSLNWQGAAAGTVTNTVNVASTGGISNRGGGALTLSVLSGLPTQGILELNNDVNSTAAISLGVAAGNNYPTLTGDITFQFSGNRFTTAANTIAATTITNSLDVGAAPPQHHARLRAWRHLDRHCGNDLVADGEQFGADVQHDDQR
jgi:fibronectin-binding autotransporter adhesin